MPFSHFLIEIILRNPILLPRSAITSYGAICTDGNEVFYVFVKTAVTVRVRVGEQVPCILRLFIANFPKILWPCGMPRALAAAALGERLRRLRLRRREGCRPGALAGRSRLGSVCGCGYGCSCYFVIFSLSFLSFFWVHKDLRIHK